MSRLMMVVSIGGQSRKGPRKRQETRLLVPEPRMDTEFTNSTTDKHGWTRIGRADCPTCRPRSKLGTTSASALNKSLDSTAGTQVRAFIRTTMRKVHAFLT